MIPTIVFPWVGVVEHLFGDVIRYRRLYLRGLPGCARVIDKSGQATKGVWWMPWHREAMKDVVACDMLRGAGKRALIRRFLNAETRLGDPQSSRAECIGAWRRTQGTETSKYLEEKKETSIP